MSVYLSKYPVRLNNNEYKVTVFDSYVTLGQYQLIARVYKTKSINLLFGYNLLFNKMVYENKSGWNKYSEWVGRYVEFASSSVKYYENELKRSQEWDDKVDRGKGEFEKWDGVIHGSN